MQRIWSLLREGPKGAEKGWARSRVVRELSSGKVKAFLPTAFWGERPRAVRRKQY